MPPPRTFNRSRSNFISRSHAITWAAKASLISIRSMSASERPVFSRTFWVAGTGPIPMISGSTPAQDQPITRASGSLPSARARDSLVSTIAAAPSVMPLELPAVTVPPGRNTAFSFASASIVVPGRGCSSPATVSVEPFGPGVSTVKISAALAASPVAAFCCDSNAKASCSCREMS